MALKVFSIPALPRVNNGAGRMLPAATTLFAALISVLPVHIPGYAALTPAFTLMAAYHWTIYRPDLLPPLALFAIGLAEDLLGRLADRDQCVAAASVAQRGAAGTAAISSTAPSPSCGPASPC